MKILDVISQLCLWYGKASLAQIASVSRLSRAKILVTVNENAALLKKGKNGVITGFISESSLPYKNAKQKHYWKEDFYYGHMVLKTSQPEPQLEETLYFGFIGDSFSAKVINCTQSNIDKLHEMEYIPRGEMKKFTIAELWKEE